jgi:excinuclease ABC subunit A
MLKSSARPVIRLRGVRHNNLKNFDLDLPLNQLIVITGLSGSGKSSLAFDTLFAEGQRRYIETFSPYARQFFDRMDKPQVDSIEGIPPAIAIEQRNAVRTTRSTVGTMTEICDYMKLLWPQVAQLHCRQCGRPVRKESPELIWNVLRASGTTRREVLISFDLPLSDKLSLQDSLGLVAKQGYQRLLVAGQVVRLEDAAAHGVIPHASLRSLTIVQDRLTLTDDSRPRFIEACEQAYHFGKGNLEVHELDLALPAPGPLLRFSNRLHCAPCDLEYREPSPALFSFNHPVGACPTCKGFGRIISIDYDLALPDRSKTLAQGAVRPWQTGQGAECQTDLLRMCRRFKVPVDVPFEQLPKKWQDFVIEGEPDYGKDEEHEWPRAWYGIKGYFRWLESKAYKMHVRVLLSRYRAYTPCPDCHGKRFQPEALLYLVSAANSALTAPKSPGVEDRPASSAKRAPAFAQPITLADFYQLPVRDALAFIGEWAASHPLPKNDPKLLILNEVRNRLGYLEEVGLGYLTLDRPTRSLSGGETERVTLTTCLGSCLVNTLFVLDEPSVGLHSRDTERLVRILEHLRDVGNTVVVVEHEASVMRAANQLVDLGPGHGATGGHIVFQGTWAQILKAKDSLTGQYLSGSKRIELPQRRPVHRSGDGSSPQNARTKRMGTSRPHPYQGKSAACNKSMLQWLTLSHATRHNIKDLTVAIPLARLVCVTGVSGSGKTTLMRELLLPALAAKLRTELAAPKASDRLVTEQTSEQDPDNPNPATGTPHAGLLQGWETLGRVLLVDQSILGKTPRSNPAVYIGAFDEIRELFAQTDAAKQRSFSAGSFSFNSTRGQCERCRGAGFEKIEMQFLSDIFIRCPDCDGRRYRAHILEVKISPQSAGANPKPKVQNSRSQPTSRPTAATALSIADVLDLSVEEAVDFLSGFVESRPARRAVESLSLLQDVGLGYLKLGQPINTLSGGESQRLKLVRHLAEANLGVSGDVGEPEKGNLPDTLPNRLTNRDTKPILFLFDEPTTGLHFDDVRVLLKVFQRLVDAGHSVVVIEHNLDVIKCADWLLDLGPDAGDQGGQIVVQGTPEQVANCSQSQTGLALLGVFSMRAKPRTSRS